MRDARTAAAVSAALLLLAACSQTTGDTTSSTPAEATDETSTVQSPATPETAEEMVIPADAAEYCAIVLADPQFDRPPETPEEYEEQYTTFLENDRRLAEAAPPAIAEDVAAIVADFADFVEAMEANGWSPEGLDDVEIWDQERVERVDAYDIATCGAPEQPQ